VPVLTGDWRTILRVCEFILVVISGRLFPLGKAALSVVWPILARLRKDDDMSYDLAIECCAGAEAPASEKDKSGFTWVLTQVEVTFEGSLD
jgi:hypothetical protein